MRHIVDIETWERRDNYNFFRGFVNSWYSITTEIDCTEASAAARASGHSFFLYYLYAVVRRRMKFRNFVIVPTRTDKLFFMMKWISFLR